MSPPNPFTIVTLSGGGVMRGVTLPLPCAKVRNFLPAGLDLFPQDVTPPGTHPVILFYHDLFRAQMSIPTLLPSLTYREHSFGIPYTALSPDSLTPGQSGPYYYMPVLYLDNFWATLGGRMFWGYPKVMAQLTVTAERYKVCSLAGEHLTSLMWSGEGSGIHRPVAEYPNFAPVRQMLSQPLITQVPFGVGPFFVISNFDKHWAVATLRPMHTAVEVETSYVTGLDCGRYPASGWSEGIDTSVLGSYELVAPWRICLPYSPLLSFGVDT